MRRAFSMLYHCLIPSMPHPPENSLKLTSIRHDPRYEIAAVYRVFCCGEDARPREVAAVSALLAAAELRHCIAPLGREPIFPVANRSGDSAYDPVDEWSREQAQ
jgi:hypothetical protein